jgi:predicted RNase H-like HicB family nuclease
MVQIDFDMIVFREGQSYVACCPELDVSSCGRDVDEARANLKTAVRLLIEETARLGTLDQVLQDAGYVPDGMGGYISPKVVATESTSVAVGAGRCLQTSTDPPEILPLLRM